MFSSILSAIYLSLLPRLWHWFPSHFPIKISLLFFFCFSFTSLVSILLFPFLGTHTPWSLYTFLIYNLNEVHGILSSGKPHHCLQLFHPLWNLYIVYSSFKMLSNTVPPLDTFLRLHGWNWKMFLPKPEPGTAHSFQFKCWF